MSAPTRQLFGTDGIRGEAGKYPLDAETVLRLGQAAADVFLALRAERGDRHHDWPSVVIGKDTRQSGDMLETAIAAGLNSRGIDVRLAGVIPTPAVAWLTRETGAAFGIVISASHNPFGDNGVKFFGPDGYKLDDALELAIERRLLAEKVDPPAEPLGAAQIGRTGILEDAQERYIDFVCAMSHDDRALFRGKKFALDSANGAAFETSEAILRQLGAEVVPFFQEPNGLNINRDCGCTHPEVIEKLVRETGADAGISHDGDADRVLLCDETGSVLDGDELMAVGAVDLLERGELAGDTLVATVMSNAGLEAALQEHGGHLVRSKVGDRYVMEEMRKGGFNFGGEQSGHLIYRDLNTTGDGIVAAVQLLSVMVRTGKSLGELRKTLTKFPQAQRNLRVSSKPPVETLPEVRKTIETAESELKAAGAGRVLVRYSGTEALVRILVEGADGDQIESIADRIRDAFAAAIGA